VHERNLHRVVGMSDRTLMCHKSKVKQVPYRQNIEHYKQ
jgi:hypothetical protein